MKSLIFCVAGLKESKLGILAESKLTPASGAVDTGGNTAVTAKTDTSGACMKSMSRLKT